MGDATCLGERKSDFDVGHEWYNRALMSDCGLPREVLLEIRPSETQLLQFPQNCPGVNLCIGCR